MERNASKSSWCIELNQKYNYPQFYIWSNLDQIRFILDLWDMEKVARPTHFPMPTAEDFKHMFAGSDMFSVINMGAVQVQHCGHGDTYSQ